MGGVHCIALAEEASGGAILATRLERTIGRMHGAPSGGGGGTRRPEARCFLPHPTHFSHMSHPTFPISHLVFLFVHRGLFLPHPTISPICRTPLFPYLTFYSFRRAYGRLFPQLTRAEPTLFREEAFGWGCVFLSLTHFPHMSRPIFPIYHKHLFFEVFFALTRPFPPYVTLPFSLYVTSISFLRRFLWAYGIVESRGLVLPLGVEGPCGGGGGGAGGGGGGGDGGGGCGGGGDGGGGDGGGGGGEKRTALVPFADMLNCSALAQLAWPRMEQNEHKAGEKQRFGEWTPFLPYVEPRFCHLAGFDSPKMEKTGDNALVFRTLCAVPQAFEHPTQPTPSPPPPTSPLPHP